MCNCNDHEDFRQRRGDTGPAPTPPPRRAHRPLARSTYPQERHPYASRGVVTQEDTSGRMPSTLMLTLPDAWGAMSGGPGREGGSAQALWAMQASSTQAHRTRQSRGGACTPTISAPRGQSCPTCRLQAPQRTTQPARETQLPSHLSLTTLHEGQSQASGQLGRNID